MNAGKSFKLLEEARVRWMRASTPALLKLSPDARSYCSLRPQWKRSSVFFTFGDGRKVYSQALVLWPLLLEKRVHWLHIEILPGDLELLLDLGGLADLRKHFSGGP